MAQDFRAIQITRDIDGSVRVTHQSAASFYYNLVRGDQIQAITNKVDMSLGTNGVGTLRDRLANASAAFYVVSQVPVESPLDADQDGIDDVYELEHRPALDPLNPTDAGLINPAAGGFTYLQEYQRETLPLLTLAQTSPQAGEAGVSVTRKTILSFTGSLATNTVINGDSFFATYAGLRLLSRVELGSDRRKVTLFYLESLPAASRVRVTLLGAGLMDDLGRSVDLDGDGQPGGDLVYDFDTMGNAPIPSTAVVGHVFASDPIKDGLGSFTNRPLQGVTVTVDGAEETLRVTTDETGYFKLEPAPAGRFFVHVDGRTAVGSQWPSGAYYPFVGKAWEAVVGVETNLAGGTGEIFLPLVAAGVLQPVSATQATPITFLPEIIAANPALKGVGLVVPANALFSDNGTRGGRVGIAPVPPDRLPSPLPPGLKFPLVITVQTDGPQNFDQPVPVTFPNLPDPVTGEKLLPGAKSALWSFNHDLGEWDVVGPMTVSSDGSLISTDPGVGIRQPGWHGVQPGSRLNLYPRRPCRDANDTVAAINGAINGFFKIVGSIFSVADDGTGAVKDVTETQLLGENGVVKFVSTVNDLNDAIDCRKSPESCGKTFVTVAKMYAGKAVSITRASAIGKLVVSATEVYKNWKEFGFNWAALDNIPRCDSIDPLSDPYAGVVPGNPGPPDPVDEPVNLAIRDAYNEAAEELPLLMKAEQALKDLQPLADKADPEAPDFGLAPGEFDQLAALIRQYADIMNPMIKRGFYIKHVQEAALLLQQRVRRISAANGLPQEGNYYIQYRVGGQMIREHVQGLGSVQRALAADRSVSVSFYEATTGLYGRWSGMMRGNGQPTDVGPVLLARSGDIDTDHDGLTDEVEEAIGTDPTNPDTNHDGISDGAAVAQGLDPLGNPGSQSGILATVPVPGTIIDITAANQRVITAEGNDGITVFTVFSGVVPQRVAQVATPGYAQRVASTGTLVAVADGTAGLVVVDVTDPPAAQITRQFALGEAISVAADGDRAFVGTADGKVFFVNMRTGLVLSKVTLDGPVRDLSLTGDYLYALTDNTLHAISWLEGNLQRRSSANSPWYAVPNRRLFAGGGVAWAVHNKGFNTFSLDDPAKPVLLAVRNTPEFGWKQMVPNGNGLGIAAADPILAIEGPNDIDIYDLSNPADQGGYLNTFPTPGIARTVALYGGLAYVGDSPAGLDVLNPVPFDNKKVPPTVALSVNHPEGIEEGKLYRLTATATDDVQIREVEFYVNDQRILVDGAFPFEASLLAPRYDDKAPTNQLRLRARAIDTGGNSAWSSEVILALGPDVTPPSIISYDPIVACNTGSDIQAISVTFSEPVSTDSLTGALHVFGSGLDGIPGTADDVEVLGGTTTYSADLNMATLTLPAPLAGDTYHVVIGPGVADLRGNKTAVFDWLFSNSSVCHLVDSDTSVATDDLSLDGGDVVVTGATLTISGAHHFRSLLVFKGGVVTHPAGSDGGLDLVVDHSVAVDKFSSISATARGYNQTGGPGGVGNVCCGQSAGGGGHGGFGGSANNSGGSAYGSVIDPDEFGSGGGTLDSGNGGSGGGLIRLSVGKLFRLEGRVEADGADGHGNSGAGAGGGIKIKAAVFAGSGVISASGGSAPVGGGGGGGRIALYYGQGGFSGLVTAEGGSGANRGGAGSIYRSEDGPGGSELVIHDVPGGQHYTGINQLPPGLSRLRIDNAVVELDGEQTVGSLVVSRGALLTHPSGGVGLHLTVQGDVTIEDGGALSVDGRGYGQNGGPGGVGNVCCGEIPGGGGHGGFGGSAHTTGGAAYGSVTNPATPGSGGGTLDSRGGGSGGGALRLDVGGTLRVNGRLTADGSAASSNSGGGAGGSLWIKVSQLAGSGVISASGGNAPVGGGGGGGRIALYYRQDLFTGVVATYGGTGYTRGGAGTVYREVVGDPGGKLLIYDIADYQSYTGVSALPVGLKLMRIEKAAMELDGDQTMGNLVVARGALLTHPAVGAGLHLIVQGDITVEEGGSVSVDGRGYNQNGGPGNVGNVCCGQSAGGGGHGGFGGSAQNAGGVAYGSVATPDTLGSGGGTLDSRGGGSGGGALRLDVGGTLQVNGRLTADGSTASSNSGGGAGGSLWLKVHQLAGSGVISASGGNAPVGGGGGGGRIALYYGQDSFTGVVATYGGTGSTRGGAGTVYRQVDGDTGGKLFVYDIADYQSYTGVSPLPINLILMRIEKAAIELDGDQTMGNLDVAAGALLTHPVAGLGLHLVVQGDVTVEAGGFVSVDGRGYSQNAGPGGVGNVCCGQSAGGGGHGGFGGSAQNAGGAAYGSVATPDTLGSGGGTLDSRGGGSGGGALRLEVGGTLRVNGRLTADGGAASSNSGGGAGGSLWLTVHQLAGGGVISASGGNAPVGGGGGGGRMALYYGQDSFTGLVATYGGTGVRRGGAGTVYRKVDVDPGGKLLVYDIADYQSYTGVSALPIGVKLLHIEKAAIELDGDQSMGSLEVAGGGLLTHPAVGVGLHLIVSGDITVDDGGSVSVDGRGYSQNGGPGGVGNVGNGQLGAGGGHGGFGGAAQDAGGAAYGSVATPETLGSGGGTLDGQGGGSGGGALRLDVGGTLQVNGRLTADGSAASGNSGGGAGGSLWLTVHQLAGGGVISASGGNAPNGGGGGGGRIALYYGQDAFTGVVATYGGTGSTRGGAGTVYRQVDGDTGGKLFVYDTADYQSYTGVNPVPTNLIVMRIEKAAIELDGDQTMGNLDVAAGALLTHPVGGIGLHLIVPGNVTIEDGGYLSVDGRGYGQNGGPGGVGNVGNGQLGAGGGHGGFGGSAQNAGGAAYGSITNPATLGSGGGTLDGQGGGAGGGALQLDVAGTLRVNGRLTADGGAASGNSGGGAGGSLWITVGQLAGTGVISASGGNAPVGGGGGGGRMALYYGQDSFTGLVATYGGTGVRRGGAGTVYRQVVGDTGGKLSIRDVADYQSYTGVSALPIGVKLLHIEKAAIELDGDQSMGSLEVAGGGLLTHPAVGVGLHLIVSGDITVDDGGSVSVDGRGYSQNGGPGGVGNVGNGQLGAGGGHGGFGGAAQDAGGAAYGSVATPETLGSGGGTLDGQGGGSGGGALRLDVGGTLQVNGRLTADGSAASGNSGGGAGGSLWLAVHQLAGSGLITASGGTAPNGGGGGGGRIALYYGQDAFTGVVATYGGTGSTRGGAGTVYRRVDGDTGGKLLVYDIADHRSYSGVTPLPSDLKLLRIEKAAIELDGDQTLGNLEIASGGLLTHPVDGVGLHLIVPGDLTVEAGGSLSADSRGYGQNGGAGGAGNVCCGQSAGGGGHGGFGGPAQNAGGAAYGSVTSPTTMGSGGGTLDSGGGGRGAGALRLDVAGTLSIDGRLTVDGGPAAGNSGGGAGGSLWLTVHQLAGGGVISASGGNAPNGGGGGGGRIALYYGQDAFTGVLATDGGSGSTRGGAGTIYRLRDNASLGSLLVYDSQGTMTYTGVDSMTNDLATIRVANAYVQFVPMTNISHIEIGSGGLAAFSGALTADDVKVGTNGIVTHPFGQTGFYLTVNSDMVVESGGAVSADRLGFGARSGPGAAGNVCCGQLAGGAGYGGVGGNGNGAGGGTYGTDIEPVDLGSGGGTLDSGGAGAGGGAIRLDVHGQLLVAGRLSANAGDGVGNGGGGSGGSLWISASILAGAGSISADGGNATGGGGGGGRLALYTTTDLFTGTVTANGGASTAATPGQAGTIVEAPLR